MPPCRRSVRAATARSGITDSSKYMSPAWLATAENTSGLRIASTSAPKPPDDLPPIARASRRRPGAEAGVDRRQHLADQVGLVVAQRRRVDVLRAAPAGEAVGRDDDRLAHPAARHQAVEPGPQPRLPGAVRRTSSRRCRRSRPASRSPGSGARARSRTTAAARPPPGARVGSPSGLPASARLSMVSTITVPRSGELPADMGA